MMKYKYLFINFFILKLVSADLPIHGLLNDIKGFWSFKTGKVFSDGIPSCGGGVPNMNLENLTPELKNFSQYIEKKHGFEDEFQVFLSDSRITINSDVPPRNQWQKLSVMESVDSDKSTGTWTMVYDEGFEMNYKEKIFFGLLKYSPKDSSNCPAIINGDNEDDFGKTNCYETDPNLIHMGWFVEVTNDDEKPMKWGCFHGQKINKVKTKPSFVVHSPKNFTDLHNNDFVLDHNRNIKSKWVALNHDQFNNKSDNELRMATKNLGYQKYHSSYVYSLPLFLQKDYNHDSTYACKTLKSTSMLKTSKNLPEFWSWGDPFISENYDSENDDVMNQGNCGSCYAVSSVFVLQKRFEILFNKLFESSKITMEKLSPQSILSCSPFNQGCEGGYPYLVGKHAREIGVSTAQCMDYLASDSPSSAPCKIHIGDLKRSPLKSENGCDHENRWYAKDYGYVGGCYECCSEDSMMHEIFLHGPIVAAIDAPEQLFLYRNGIFDVLPNDHGKVCDDPGKNLNGWEYTNHAVSIIGWGEDNSSDTLDSHPTKYWIVRNTWGRNWGKEGYIKVPRGINFAGIESQAVYIDPDFKRGKARKIVEKELKKQPLFKKTTKAQISLVQNN